MPISSQSGDAKTVVTPLEYWAYRLLMRRYVERGPIENPFGLLRWDFFLREQGISGLDSVLCGRLISKGLLVKIGPKSWEIKPADVEVVYGQGLEVFNPVIPGKAGGMPLEYCLDQAIKFLGEVNRHIGLQLVS